MLGFYASGSWFDVKLVASKPVIVLTGFDTVAKSMLLRLTASLAKHDVSSAEKIFCKFGGDGANLTINVDKKCEVRLECGADVTMLTGSSCVESILVPAARAAMQLMTEPEYRAASMKIVKPAIDTIARLKVSVDDDMFVDVLAEYRRVINEAVEEINRVSAKHGVSVQPEDLDPLSILIDNDVNDVVVRDRRSGARLEHVLPSAVAAVATVKLLLYAAARGSETPLLIAIEEPEIGATPAQQLVFAKLAARLVELSWRHDRPLILAVTTHSPYIAYGLAPAANVYHVYRDSNGRISISTETPFVEYAIADVLWMNMHKANTTQHQ